MDTYKAVGVELKELKAAAEKLKEANAAMAKAKKSADAAKEYLAKWLKEERQVTLETLECGKRVLIDQVVLITIGSQLKFDAAAFELAEPKLYEHYKKHFPVKKFDAL